MPDRTDGVGAFLTVRQGVSASVHRQIANCSRVPSSLRVMDTSNMCHSEARSDEESPCRMLIGDPSSPQAASQDDTPRCRTEPMALVRFFDSTPRVLPSRDPSSAKSRRFSAYHLIRRLTTTPSPRRGRLLAAETQKPPMRGLWIKDARKAKAGRRRRSRRDCAWRIRRGPRRVRTIAASRARRRRHRAFASWGTVRSCPCRRG